MPYQALARKWRPRDFDEVVGQEHVVKALTHALLHERTHHAYLFSGTRGVGKTTIARILAKALNCEQRRGYNPCGMCTPCRELDAGRFVDLIEVDAASRTKVEDTRELLENCLYSPGQGRYKIYLIDEVHMLSGHSFNALLKTLEEPPSHIKFLLATTDPQKIPVTVLSRCLQFNLKHLSADQIRHQMEHILQKESVTYEPGAIRALARAAQGSMRDALSLLDQAIVHGGGTLAEQEVGSMLGTVARKPLFSILFAIGRRDAGEILGCVEELSHHTPNFLDALQQLLQILHHAAIAQWSPASLKRDEDAEQIGALTEAFSAEDLQLFYQIALIGQRDLPYASDPRSGFEMILLRMLAFRPDSEPESTDKSSVKGRIVASAADSPRRPRPSVTTEPPVGATTRPANDWEQIIDAIGLVGMSRQLAQHCALRDFTESACALLLDAAHVQLRTPQVEHTLAQALSQHRGHPVKLTIEVGEPGETTPAARQRRAREQRQQAAEQAIASDENVKAIQELFGAQIIPGSVRPLD
jgi:DNA polymerase-3 subunit gamma/tau